LKPSHFADIDEAKHSVKALKYFTNPCVVLIQTSEGPAVDPKFWRMVENYPR
jgi:hypothetical protein